MKAYLITTGAAFGLLTLAHLWRLAVESALVRDPWFIVTTGMAATLFFWALHLLRAVRSRSMTAPPAG